MLTFEDDIARLMGEQLRKDNARFRAMEAARDMADLVGAYYARLVDLGVEPYHALHLTYQFQGRM